MAEIYACAQCGTEDEAVAGGGTALCYLCAELSALQAPAKERRWRRRLLIARLTGADLAQIWLFVLIWLIVVAVMLVLCGRQIRANKQEECARYLVE